MAKRNVANTSTQKASTFDKSILTDAAGNRLPEGAYVFARNVINSTKRGDKQKRITEPANTLCTYAPYTVIGVIHLEKDRWLIYSANGTDSEIGLLEADVCQYNKLVNDQCLGFKPSSLIIGVARPTFDCSFRAYWDEDNSTNPSRTMDIKKIPWIQNCTTVNGCTTCVDTDELDCDKIRLENYIAYPCIDIQKSPATGSILNGSYQAFISYTINQQKVTDYLTQSNVVAMFDHGNINNALTITLSNLDKNFEEYQLVLVSTIAEKTVARVMGLYSTEQNIVTIDYIDLTLPVIPLTDLPLQIGVPDRSEGMFNVNNYLLRINPVYKFDFNYQPLANQIATYWQAVEYRAEYYKKAGTNVGYMRDEVYAFFIRFIYNTGDKSRSYHIPGRAPGLYQYTTDAGTNGGFISETANSPTTVNDIESPNFTPKVYEVFNTASLISTPNTQLADGGVVVAEGLMGYHQSTELYDDDNPEVWDTLCGQPIRHHRFPDNIIMTGGTTNNIANHYKDGGEFIRVMGVRFDNIQPPVDNNGNVISNIVGYEILRANRTGHQTVLYKGIINNMFELDIPDMISGKKALYPNYPYNDLNADPFISKNPDPVTYEPSTGLTNYDPNDQYSRKHFTFHSPDTSFERPFLGEDELKIYGMVWGESRGYYKEVDKHPRHKFVTDLSFIVSIIVGFGYAISKIVGTRDVQYRGYVIDSDPLFFGTSNSPGDAFYASALATGESAINGTLGLQGMLDAFTGQNIGPTSVTYATKAANVATTRALAFPGSGVTSGSIDVLYKDQDSAPGVLRAFQAIPLFLTNMSDGIDTTLGIIRSTGAWHQFVLQYQSVCKYENFAAPYANNLRKKLDESRYLRSDLQDFKTTHIINNIFRAATVVCNTLTDVRDITGAIEDVSRPQLLSALPADSLDKSFDRRASSHYVGFKRRIRNQYGQLRSLNQVPVSTCYTPIGLTGTGTLFGGDTYIGKYSEKNTLYYFNDWLKKQPDGEIFNYFKHKMFDHTAFWMDTDPFDIAEFSQSIPAALSTAIQSSSVSTFFQSIVTPSDKHCFDRLPGNNGYFLLKRAYMYLFNSGVRDFFVESEYNVDYRDYEDTEAKKHYPVLSDLKQMFDIDLIKADNFYKIDKSLSINFLPGQKVSWALLQDADYRPSLAETCYTKKDRRIIYSLPQDTLQKKDNWSVFLPNNYKDFTSDIVSIKPINKTGAIILFSSEAPIELPGVDELQTTGGTKITIGDGGLFSRRGQALSNSEAQFQYGSCQSRMSVLNCPAGTFWMNLDQGKIFQFAGQLRELSLQFNEKWFNLYLPYKLLQDFPTYDLLDNPVVGIGCQTIYDNENGLVYFCKKDYRLKPNLPVTLTYIGDGLFSVDGLLNVYAGDPLYFDNASWTISYDPIEQEFISFHDWHPDLALSGKNTFLTTKRNGFWRHNQSCQLFCNYYGVDYPFELEFEHNTQLNVTTLRSIEYYLEAFVYDMNCYDRFHVLNHAFDEAVVYNTEQVSGLLRLILQATNDPFANLVYPIINLNSIDILYMKEEHKYRFNQFFDITNDRGEFSNIMETIWKTEDNGYIRVLNPANLNYNKNEFERKKFRHHTNRVLLKRLHSGNVEMVVDIAVSKHQLSSR